MGERAEDPPGPTLIRRVTRVVAKRRRFAFHGAAGFITILVKRSAWVTLSRMTNKNGPSCPGSALCQNDQAHRNDCAVSENLKLKKSVPGTYTEEATTRNVEGTVVLCLTVVMTAKEQKPRISVFRGTMVVLRYIAQLRLQGAAKHNMNCILWTGLSTGR